MQDPTAEDYTPPITRSGEVLRYAAAGLVSLSIWATVAIAQWQESRIQFWVDVGVGTISFVGLALRRRHPFATAMIVNVLSTASALASGPALLATVSLATRRVVWQIIVVGVVSIVTGILFTGTQPDSTGSSRLISAGLIVVIVTAVNMWGMYLGSRRELLWSLRERARQAEAQRDLLVRAARTAERQNIAREMHDVLAHRISMVSMHAGALAYRSDLPAEQVKETAALIQQGAHAALTDLREVLGVLRSSDSPQSDRPQPTLADIPELLEEARAAGMQVMLVANLVEQADETLPALASRTLYRVIQEGLTNARKHAPDTHVTVHLSGSPESGCDVWVRNPSPVSPPADTPGAGVGLIGLRERTRLAGGVLDFTSDRSGSVLHVWLPWEHKEDKDR